MSADTMNAYDDGFRAGWEEAKLFYKTRLGRPPRCEHGTPLIDHSGNLISLSCGCSLSMQRYGEGA